MDNLTHTTHTLVGATIVFTAPVSAAVKTVWFVGVAAIAAAGIPGIPREPARIAAGCITLLAVAVYIGVGVAAHGTARAEARAAGLDIVDVMVAPRPGTPFHSEIKMGRVGGVQTGHAAGSEVRGGGRRTKIIEGGGGGGAG
ncbi:MAG: hypothetical protein WD995_04265, partial [Gemmatimonadota bacterium]